jgi:transcriptional regulator with XRE-family HTH domain
MGSKASTPQKDEQNELRDVIGRRLAALRAEQGLSVSKLARAVGVSPSAVSQIERGQARPSVATLFALSRALNVPTDAFFDDSAADPEPASVAAAPPRTAAPDQEAATTEDVDPHRFVLRQANRPTLQCEDGVEWQRLTSTALDGLEFLELIYAPHAESDTAVYRHRGFEFVVMTKGRMCISVGFEEHELLPGDSIAFPSWIPHRYVNPGDEEARAFTVIFDDLSNIPLPLTPTFKVEADGTEAPG